MSHQIKNHQLSQIIHQNERIIRALYLIAREVEPPFLHRIKISFTKGSSMPTIGPAILTAAGQQVTASVAAFDQNGQPFLGTVPAATFTSDDTAQAIVQFDPTTGLTTAVSNGVANISATLTTAEGLSLSDTETVTVAIPVTPPPPQVLSSIKVQFA